MAYISLDKLKFYKDDIVDGKIYIKGSISGLDSNKQYCIMWSCAFCDDDINMYSQNYNYYYLKNRSSTSLTNSGAHLNLSDIVWNTGKDYADIYVFINEVNGNCETVTNELVDYKYITIYNKYAPVSTGTLNCTSYPTGAGIYVNDRYYGLTNRDIDLNPGSYSVKFTKDGYEDYTRTIVIEAGKTTYMSKDLVPEADTPGTLRCTSNPTGAGIYINTIYQGLTNKDITYLNPGSYSVTLTKTGYENYTETILIEAGKTTFMSADLVSEAEPEEPTIGEITSIPSPELVGDEVIFKVNIKNIGSKTAFYYIDLWDENHTLIDKEPDTYLYYLPLEPGETGIITISSEWKSWNVDSILNQTIQFDLRGAEITWAGARPIVGYYITDTLTFEYVPPEEEEEEQVIPCTNYTTKSECEENGCYWWESDQTCQSMPEGTTEYFDIIIKPYSWYSYNTAVNNTIKKLSDIGGALSNLLYKYTDIQYNGIDILEDVNKEHIIIRIYIISKSQSDSQISTLVFPAFIIAHPVLVTAIVGVIAGIMLFTVGFIIGTSGGNFTKSDITQLLENILKNAKIDAYVYGYDINKIVAIKLMDCLETIETCEDSLSCFTNTGVTPSLQNQMEVLVTYQTTVDAAYTGVADILDDEEYEKLALKTISQLEFVIEKMESATITPDGAACEASDVMDDAGEDLKKKEEEQKEEECAWELFDTCIISKDTFKILTWGAIGVGGLILYSATKR